MNIFQSLIDHLDQDQFIRSPGSRTQQIDLNVAQAVDSALADPLHYPAFEQSVFPGDRVAIVVQAGLPAARAVLNQVFARLEQIDFAIEDLVVVISQQTAKEFGFSPAEISESVNPQAENLTPDVLKSIDGRTISFHVHNPYNQAELAYVAANAQGDPIYLSRRLVDADVILPIGFCTAAGETSGQDCLYPEFSSIETKRRFNHGDLSPSQIHDEVKLANDNVGSFSAVQVISGPGNSVEDIIFGERNEVLKKSLQETCKLWQVDVGKKVEAVVATIETTIGKPSWDDFLRAVLVAEQLAADETPIIVWSQLDHLPKSKIRRAMLAQFGESVGSNLPTELQQLSEIMREHPVYLYSELNADDVEELGVGFIENADQINRICSSFETCLLLRDAHKCSVESGGKAQTANP